MTGSSALSPLFHVGIVVRDLDAAAADYAARYGLAMDREMVLTVEEGVFRGAPASFTARMGFVALGNTDLELIEPLRGASPYAAFLAETGEGIHHVAFVVDAIDAHLERLRATSPDCSLLLDATDVNGVRFAYVEGTAHGAIVELLQPPPGVSLFPE
jgi:methylmalonyl-CoA/ethylmalonyl-CoA epimerase